MSVQQAQAFAAKTKADPYLAERLKACMKTKELFALAREQGYRFDRDAIQATNKAQFTEDQLSDRLGSVTEKLIFNYHLGYLETINHIT